jgi:hypothetical protein
MSLSYTCLAVLGVFVGAAGTVAHRYHPYWGSVLVLGLVMCAGTYARAWKSWIGMFVFDLAWLATVLFIYWYTAPGGSILIIGDTLGKIWIFGGVAVAVLPAFLPRRLVTEVSLVEQ